MARLVIFAALFLAGMIAAANATTTYTTVVTTTVTDEENPRQQECQTEIQKKSMSHCRSWMMEGRELQFLRTAVANPRYQEEHLKDCCDQMKIISPMCRCDAIRKMMMDSQKTHGSEEMEHMRKKAESLPMMCQMDMPTECKMRAVFF